MKPGIYNVKFTSSLRDFGEGLAVLKDGKINGGDQGYLYLGAYDVSGSGILAKIKVQKWNPGATSVFGNSSEFELDLKGSIAADASTFSVIGAASQMPQMKIAINGRRLADVA